MRKSSLFQIKGIFNRFSSLQQKIINFDSKEILPVKLDRIKMYKIME
jgi:hypothetical protein